MVVKLLIQFILLFFTINNNSSTLVDYYVNLIKNEIARTQTFNLPLSSSNYEPWSKDVTAFGKYDYIVIGAGSAGSVIANRLTEDPQVSVLLLEAGGNGSEFTDIPSMNVYSMSLEYNWNFNSTPQTTSCLGMINRECPYPTGKGLGGTSIINALMYVRGNKLDYNNWYLQGNPGWSYKGVLPYFKKSENSKLINGDSGYHGFGGYLNVEYHKPQSPELLAFIAANKELGRKVLDYNGKDQLGVAQTQHNTIHGRRHSVGRAFLDPVQQRPNLSILTHAFVTKILINNKKEAYGVLFTNKDYGVFDHIIIGAGTSGAVIANRLSEDNFRRILVLEAGGLESNFSNIPAMAPYLQGLEYNWNFYSTPQTTSCVGMVQKQCYYPRGKGLGGTTIINGLSYARGHKKDYDNWFAQGNIGWSYHDLQPYFDSLEQVDCKQSTNSRFKLEYHEPINQQTSAFFKANQEMGLDVIEYNNNSLGVFRPKFATVKGQRLSTARAFLQPILHRKNIKILKNSFVVKILLNHQKEAYGVIFSKDGKLYVAKSRRDIILSAGVFGSPQILMLSGIGPRFHLENLGIPVFEELPVGNGFEDHAVYPNLEFTTNYTEASQSFEDDIKSYLTGVGLLTSAGNEGAKAYFQTKYSKTADIPNIELSIIYSNNTNDFTEVFNYNQNTYTVVTKDSDPSRSFTIKISLLHPKSKGYFRLNSVNPFEYPRIDPRMLSDPDDEDLETLYEGIKYALKLANTTAFLKIDAKLKDQTLPACQKYDYLTKYYWHCQLRHLGTSAYSPVATCKMGPHPSKGAVVDPELRVFGIKNLRVADTSVFPTHISADPMATAIVIGEKLVDFVRSYGY